MTKLIQESRDYKLYVWAIVLLLIAFAWFCAQRGVFGDMITGEALYDFSYPARWPFWLSIERFFTERVQARFMHGVVISALYGIFEFAPHSFFFSNAVLIILGAAAIGLLLGKFLMSPWQLCLVLVVLCVLPTTIPILVNLKKLHHAFAWASFWWACVFIRLWISSNKGAWLYVGAILFICAWLAYEAIAFLLPVAVFLSTANYKAASQLWKHLAIVILVTLVAYGASRWLVSLYDLEYTRQVELGVVDILLAPLRAIPAMIGYLVAGNMAGNFLFSPFAEYFAKVLFLLLILYGIVRFLFTIFSQDARREFLSDRPFWVVVSGLWLVFVTYVPFSLVLQPPDGDSLMGAGLGVVFLLTGLVLDLIALRRHQLVAAAFVTVCGFMLVCGLLSANFQLQQTRALQGRFINFLTTLRQAVPGVREHSSFVLVNTNWGRTACLGYMNMIFARSNLWCLHLFNGDTEEAYSVTETGALVEDTGRVFQPNLIILTADPLGNVTVLDSISEQEYPDLPIDWTESQSIATSYGRILKASPKSSFWKYIETIN